MTPINLNKPNLIRQTGIPLYYQLKDIMRNQIVTGEIKEGDMLPSEKELVEIYGVSREVARHALSELAQEGFVVSRKGVGTFVNHRRLIRQIAIGTSFTRNLKNVSPEAQTQIVFQEVVPANEKLREVLRLESVEEKLVLIERAGIVDEEVLALIKAYYPLSVGKYLLNTDLMNQSIYDLLAEKFNLIPYSTEKTITVVPAPPDLAAKLDVRVSFPLLCISGTTFSEKIAPFEYSEAYYRSDRVGFTITGRHD